MKKQWLVVFGDRSITIARIAKTKRKKLKILFLSEHNLTGDPDSEEFYRQNYAGIKEWLKEQKVPLKKLKLALASRGLITRVIPFPDLDGQDLEKLVSYYCDQYSTLNIQDYIIDYRILNRFQKNGKAMLNVLLAAFPRARMLRIRTLCHNLGFRPKIVDLTADCLARFYGHFFAGRKTLRKNQDEADPSDLAIVSLNKGGVECVVLEKGSFFLFADMELDLDSDVEEFDKTINASKKLESVQELLELAAARRTDKTEFELEDLFVPELKVEELPLEPGSPNEEQTAKGKLEQKLEPLLATLTELLSFFASNHYGEMIHKIYITGEFSNPYIAEIFQDSLGIETVVGFPLEWKPHFARQTERLENKWAKYGSLYGLALRED